MIDGDATQVDEPNCKHWDGRTTSTLVGEIPGAGECNERLAGDQPSVNCFSIVCFVEAEELNGLCLGAFLCCAIPGIQDRRSGAFFGCVAGCPFEVIRPSVKQRQHSVDVAGCAKVPELQDAARRLQDGDGIIPAIPLLLLSTYVYLQLLW